MPIDQEGLGFEMPGKFEIMRAVQKDLNSLEVGEGESDTVWTTAVKTKLCKIGRDRFGCKVCASGVDKADFGEWLYDVTWLEYEKNDRGKLVNLVDAPLVAECEWGNKGDIEDDFEKLLLARAGVRLMIFDGNYEARFQGDRRTACRGGQGVQRLPRRGCLAAGGLGKD